MTYSRYGKRGEARQVPGIGKRRQNPRTGVSRSTFDAVQISALTTVIVGKQAAEALPIFPKAARESPDGLTIRRKGAWYT